MLRWLLVLFGIGLVAVVALVWVPQAVAGPTLDCGEFDRATCDELLPDVISEAQEKLGLAGMVLPMTSVSLSGSVDCLSYAVLLLFDIGVAANCN